ncbi:50S ribosomal protein L19 [Candidatus Saccharibacteria bacterium]|nr:50S ribosomal protein L19 [Candidatus Saccharibacteria bacterium]
MEKKPKAKKKKEVKKPKVQEPGEGYRPGDVVRVSFKVREEGKERVQPFEGILIAKRGEGPSKTITVRKMGTAGVGVERIFPVNSPKVEKIEVVKKGKTRRAKLYFVREKPTLKV